VPARSYIDQAAQIFALLDAARALDGEARSDHRHINRRAMLAVLVLAGLRLGELLALRWHHVDLSGGWLTVGRAKTDAGVRWVKIRPALRGVLTELRAANLDGAPDALVFGTASGEPHSPSNIRRRVLAKAVERANAKLAEDGGAALPALTPQSLRRTFASVLYAIGAPPPVVMQEMGHASPQLALRIYAQAMRRDDAENGRLRALVGWQPPALGITDPAASNRAASNRAA
jgi:integrase